MGGTSSRPKQLSDARVVVISGAGEDEVNGVYVETKKPEVSNKSGKPSFVYAGRTRNNAAIIVWWAGSTEQWNIDKATRASSTYPLASLASTDKLWYIASAATGADVSGVLPPTSGWAVSARAGDRAMGTAAFTIDPAPQCRSLSTGESAPSAALQDMFTRGVKYASEGE
tara:strand:- start:35 stop:544 length:510 start_codon:yes stop_codon:yes gene_type:complete